jgi:hypothetical protein
MQSMLMATMDEVNQTCNAHPGISAPRM